MPITTIKVPTELRDRISAGAAREGLTAGAYLTRLVDRDDRAERMRLVSEALAANPPDESYYAELAEWDVTLMDGLEDLDDAWS